MRRQSGFVDAADSPQRNSADNGDVGVSTAAPKRRINARKIPGWKEREAYRIFIEKWRCGPGGQGKLVQTPPTPDAPDKSGNSGFGLQEANLGQLPELVDPALWGANQCCGP